MGRDADKGEPLRKVIHDQGAQIAGPATDAGSTAPRTVERPEHLAKQSRLGLPRREVLRCKLLFVFRK
jgi:hypothetical protein